MPAPFIPGMGLTNAHTQTLLPRLLRRQPVLKGHAERLDTPDGDFVDLVWSERPSTGSSQPLLVLFHGLEGSFDSPYANGLLGAFAEAGWLSVMMHFRGCSGEVNRQARAYHSGETEDARFLLETLKTRYPHSPIAVIGVSLGGNMMVNYLTQYADEPLIDDCAIVSAPLDLKGCAERIEHGFSKLYRNYLLGSLKRNALKKVELLQHELGITREQISALTRLRDFDELITAPLHGFDSALHYYQSCSGLPKLSHVKAPLLVIHAKDDPFMTESAIPNEPLPSNVRYQLSKHGGHVGFISGSLVRPQFWLEQALPEHFNYLK